MYKDLDLFRYILLKYRNTTCNCKSAIGLPKSAGTQSTTGVQTQPVHVHVSIALIKTNGCFSLVFFLLIFIL